MKTFNAILVTTAVLASLARCASSSQARSVQSSGFLGEYRSLLQPGQKGEEALLRYRNPRANWAAYRKIILEPVVIWDDPSSKLTRDQREDLQKLVNDFYVTLRMRLSRDYELVDRPAPGAMRIAAAITNGQPAATRMKVASKVVPHGAPAGALWTFATGKPAFAGEVSIEFTIQDAQTGELLAAGADRRVGTDTVGQETFQDWGDVKASLEFWTDASIYRLCVLRGRENCVRPKA